MDQRAPSILYRHSDRYLPLPGLMATGLSLNQDLFGQRHFTLFALNSTVLLEGCELALKWSLPIYVKNLHLMCMPEAYACDLSRHVT